MLSTIEVKKTEQNRVQTLLPSQFVICKRAEEVLMDVLDHVSPRWPPPILPVMFVLGKYANDIERIQNKTRRTCQVRGMRLNVLAKYEQFN